MNCVCTFATFKLVGEVKFKEDLIQKGIREFKEKVKKKRIKGT